MYTLVCCYMLVHVHYELFNLVHVLSSLGMRLRDYSTCIVYDKFLKLLLLSIKYPPTGLVLHKVNFEDKFHAHSANCSLHVTNYPIFQEQYNIVYVYTTVVTD